jgi:hypothetical protein
MRKTTPALLLAGATLLSACHDAGSPTEMVASPRFAVVAPVLLSGNPTCALVAPGTTEYKIDATPGNGVYGAGTFQVTISGFNAASQTFGWASNLPVEYVIVKGGSLANGYDYDPSRTSDTNLVSPTNPSNGQPFEISHVTICYTLELQVTKTAVTSFDRTYNWAITKESSATVITLQAGQAPVSINYAVKVENTGSTDSNWAVAGSISVFNPAAFAVSVTGVTDNITGIGAIAVNCPVTFPHSLAAGGTLTCTYSTALPDGTARTNTAAATSGTAGVGNGSGTAAVAFSTPTEIDKCVNVTDSMQGALGTHCAPLSPNPKSLTYAIQFSSADYACGETPVANTATLTKGTTNGTITAVRTVTVDKTCIEQCTLSQGYWRTHSEMGPAPYDARWITGATPQGGATSFFGHSGVSWISVFRTPPQGNAYYNLAHQYMAAVLNVENGSGPVSAAVQSALNGATAFFIANAPGAKLSGAARTNANNWASVLENFNAGPLHCTE